MALLHKLLFYSGEERCSNSAFSPAQGCVLVFPGADFSQPHQPDSTRAEGRDFDLADPEGEGKAAAEGTAETRAPLQAVEGRGDVWGAKQLPKAREDPRGWQKESGFEFTSFVSDSKEFKQYLQINFPCLRKGECLVH